jgi:tetratricopeptide (TPR) repeat protein
MAIASLGRICAQEPPPLVMPHVGGDRFGAKQEAALVKDPVVNYANRREAALAAFQAGYKAAAVEHKPERAMRLLLIALRRDSQFPPALFDMAVLCSQVTRWHDAILFLREAQKQAGADSEIAKLAAAELERLETIERLESTPDGRKRRQFDIEFVPASRKDKNSFTALSILKQATRIDPTRWEAPALAGVIHAGIGEFSESAAELEKAARLAEKSRAAQFKSAAEIARKESAFLDEVGNADRLSEKQLHDQAAQLYAKAWEESPGHWDAAREAVTEYLLADQTAPAVPLLSLMRDSAPPLFRAKALAMLKELGAISADARRAAERAPSAEQPQPKDPAARIRELVGQLTNPQMEMAARPGAPLVDDKTLITPVDDSEIGSGSSDLMVLSTESVFALYQRDLAPAAPPTGAAPEPVHSETPPEPARPEKPPEPAQAVFTAPAAPASSAGSRPRPLAERAAAEQPVAIRSNPPGATVLLDETVNCVAPCQPPLAAGRHTLLATLAGYRNLYKIFIVEKGKASPPIDLALDPKRGLLKVETEIPGAPVFLDGKETGKRTPASLSLNEGTYEVGVEIDAVQRAEKVEITDNCIKRLKL